VAERDRPRPAIRDHVTVTAPALPDRGSASRPAQHHLRTEAGRVSLWWDPGQGAFVAARGQQSWSDTRLGALARIVGITIPAQVARDLRRDERLYPGPTVQLRRAYTPPSSGHHPEPDAGPPAPADPAVAPAWPPDGAYVVPSRHGHLAVAWDDEHRCFTAVAASGDRWRAEHLDDLAVNAGARIPRAYVEDLLREAGRPAPVWDPPRPEDADERVEYDQAPLDVPDLLEGLPPGLANELSPAVSAPSQTERGGIARVEATRRAVRAEWAAWVHEAPARRALIEDLDSVMQGLARGDLLHQALRRLEALADRFGRRARVERSPTLGAYLRAHEHMTPTAPAPSAADKLHALRSRPAPAANAVGMA
jgi:hypothetical protein